MDNKVTSTKSSFPVIPARTEEVAKMILDAAIKIHTALGPGLLESGYESCLVYELKLRGLKVDKQLALPVVYEGITVDSGLRLDL